MHIFLLSNPNNAAEIAILTIRLNFIFNTCLIEHWITDDAYGNEQLWQLYEVNMTVSLHQKISIKVYWFNRWISNKRKSRLPQSYRARHSVHWGKSKVKSKRCCDIRFLVLNIVTLCCFYGHCVPVAKV